jgi:hypothetical protein
LIEVRQEYIHKNRLGHVTSLVTIRGFIIEAGKFPIQKCAIFRKFGKSVELRGGGRFCMTHKRFQTCHANGVIDAEIAGKGHLWMETP